MFIGEFGCVIPLLWQSQTLRRRRKARAQGYQAIPQNGDATEEQEEEVTGEAEGDGVKPLTGLAVCWMWFPAFFDSMSSEMSFASLTPGAAIMLVGIQHNVG